MPSRFVIDEGTKPAFAGRTLLLDTNALIDAFRLPAEFYDLAQELAKLDCDFVTTKTIATEFLGSTTDSVAIKTKQEFLEVIFNKPLGKIYLPLDHTAPNVDDILAFSRQANKFGIADYELYCTLKKYKTYIALITRNHKDFSTNLTGRIGFITYLGNKEIHTYGVYVYN